MSTPTTGSAAHHKTWRMVSVVGLAALTLSACGGDADTGSNGADSNGADSSPEASADAISIEDDHGVHEVPADPQSVVATNNRAFRILEEFGVELSAAPKPLARETDYADDESVLDLGNHREPQWEALVQAQPDLVINGQRFGQYYDDIASTVGDDVPVLEWETLFEEPDTFFEGLTTLTENLGETFGEEEVAQELIDEFNTQADRVRAAVDPDETFMGVLTSGGNINYSAPGTGRTLGPLFPYFDLQPALNADVDDDSHGDDISVEAIAEANPDWLMVLDRDAMNRNDDSEDYQPADEIIAESPALQQVPAVEQGNIVYMPDDTYLTEDIITYTEYFSDLADALESSQ